MIGSSNKKDVQRLLVLVSDAAPNWFKEGVIEQMAKGKTESQAVQSMRTSQFFQSNWILKAS